MENRLNKEDNSSPQKNMEGCFIYVVAAFVVIILIAIIASVSENSSKDSVPNADSDSITSNSLIEENNNIVDNFFKEFQKANVDWTKTKKGQKKLAQAFKNRITTDIKFAKACASYNTSSEFDNNILYSETIAPYDKKDGEEGEFKAFDFVIKVNLIKPLYNGQKYISVHYEIISTIPSTIEEHWRPYVENANYCSVFDTFLKRSYDATIDLGCYLITFKDDK